MDTLINDIRYALRSLAKSPGFAVIAVATLALGIGANTAIFSVAYGVLIRPLPYSQPEQLVGFVQRFSTGEGGTAFSYPQYRFLVDNGAVFDELSASTGLGFNLAAGNEAVRVRGLRVSANYFKMFGVAPQIGRGFTTDEDQIGGAQVVILSAALWRQQFGADRSVVGRSVLLNGTPYAVVGVMPDGFDSDSRIDVWSTLTQVSRTIGNGQNLDVVGRLRPGLTLVGASERWKPVAAAFGPAFVGSWPREATLGLESYAKLESGDISTPILLLAGSIGFVLLIACSNVANLLLSRAASRSREISVRAALGATRGRLVRQLLTESLVLAALGGVLGLAIGQWGLDGLLTLVPPDLLHGATVRMDPIVLAFTAGLSLGTGVLFGLLPAWVTARGGIERTLRSTGRTTAAAGLARLRNGLVVGEVALSLILLVGAGLLVRTMTRLMATDPGFDLAHTASAQIWLAGSRYRSTAEIDGYYRQLTERLELSPGVQSAAVTGAGLPLQRGGNTGAKIEGQADWVGTDVRSVTPSYFATFRIPVVQGRGLLSTDVEGSTSVMVVNQTFVKRYLSDGPVLGRMVQAGTLPRQIVGVVGDVRSFIASRVPPTVFVPTGQTPPGSTLSYNAWFPVHVVVRAAGDPRLATALLRNVIRETDAQIPVGDVRAMSDVLSQTLALPRLIMTLLAAFAVLAAGLAAIGLYGVISYLVQQRTHELGVRIALGARARDVVQLVLTRGIILAGMGTAVGLAGAFALTRLLRSQLYSTVSPTDPLTFVVTPVALALVATLASYVPARRASRVDPIVALRHE